MLQEIDRDIADITTAIREYQAKITLLYGQYRKAIGQAVSRQLIQAVFVLCTKEYPQAFLRLSVGQRQDLQLSLQKLAGAISIAVTEQLAELSTADLLNSEPLDKLLVDLLDRASQQANQLLTERQIIPAPQPKEEPPSQIYLRPAEVEYVDRQVMSFRSEIRVLSARCQHLQSQLSKKQQARQIVEAEQAWCLTWTTQEIS